MFNITLVSAAAFLCSSTAFAFSNIEYKNTSSDATMYVGSTEINPGDTYLNEVMPGDTQTVSIAGKTFVITDLHEVCAKEGSWPYSPTGWKMELSVDGNRVGVICAKAKFFEFITMAHSTFAVKGSAGKYFVIYSDAGSQLVSGSYPGSMSFVWYSW